MREPSIQQLFPTPVYITELDRKFTVKENKLVDKMQKKLFKNKGNNRSQNYNVLDEKVFSPLKKELNGFIKDYFDRVICPKDKITPYITQSWLNYTNKNEYHHTHNHPNSLVSGIIYMNADIATDSIKFYRHRQDAIVIPSPNNYNSFNADFWWFVVKTGQIMLFPSSLHHSVAAKQGNNIRVSLSFNVFIKGTIGSSDNLNSLTLY